MVVRVRGMTQSVADPYPGPCVMYPQIKHRVLGAQTGKEGVSGMGIPGTSTSIDAGPTMRAWQTCFFINLECLQVGGDKGPPITEVSPTGVSSDLDGTGRGFIISVVYYSRAETWRRKAPLFHLRIDVMCLGYLWFSNSTYLMCPWDRLPTTKSTVVSGCCWNVRCSPWSPCTMMYLEHCGEDGSGVYKLVVITSSSHAEAKLPCLSFCPLGSPSE